MIDPATSWFEMVELPMIEVEKKHGKTVKTAKIFDKTSKQIASLVYQLWFSRYPRYRYVIYNNGSKFRLHFRNLISTYGLRHKPTTIKNPQANAILERVHQVIGSMMRTAELGMQDTFSHEDVARFLSDASQVICTTHHTVLNRIPAISYKNILREMAFEVSREPAATNQNKV
mgnify:CR=1 FL=1